MATTSNEDFIELTDIIELTDVVKDTGTAKDNGQSNGINDEIDSLLSGMESALNDDSPKSQFNANETVTMPDMSEVNDLLNDLNIPSQKNTDKKIKHDEKDDTLDDILDDLIGSNSSKSKVETQDILSEEVDLTDIIGEFGITDEENDFFDLDASPSKASSPSKDKEDSSNKKQKPADNLDNLDDLLDSNEKSSKIELDDDLKPSSKKNDLPDDDDNIDDIMLELDDIIIDEPDTIDDSNERHKLNIDADDLDSILNKFPHSADDGIDLDPQDSANSKQQMKNENELLSGLFGGGSIDDELDSILSMAESEVSPDAQRKKASALEEHDIEPSLDLGLLELDESLDEIEQSANTRKSENTSKEASLKAIKDLDDSLNSDSSLGLGSSEPDANNKVSKLEERIKILENKLEDLLKSPTNIELLERCEILSNKIISMEEEFTKNIEKAAATAAANIIREEISNLLMK